MIIACKKCQKKLQIGEADLRPGSVFSCPGCGNTIRTKLAETPQAHSDKWTIQANGESFGPYSTEQMRLFVAEQRIIAATEVQHPDATAGKWVVAGSIKFLSDLIDKYSVPVTPPPVAPEAAVAPVHSIAPEQYASVEAVDFSRIFQSRLRPKKERTVWNFVWDFLDPSFAHFVTPTVIKVTWCLVLLMVGLPFVAVVVLIPVSLAASVLPSVDRQGKEFNPQPQLRHEVAADGIVNKYFWKPVLHLFSGVLFVVLQVLGVGLFLLWVRVVLEMFIVVFHLSSNTKEIIRLIQSSARA